MLGPFATTSRLTPIQQMSLVVLSRAACASMSTTTSTTTTTTTTTTTCDRGDRYGPMEWAQQETLLLQRDCATHFVSLNLLNWCRFIWKIPFEKAAIGKWNSNTLKVIIVAAVRYAACHLLLVTCFNNILILYHFWDTTFAMCMTACHLEKSTGNQKLRALSDLCIESNTLFPHLWVLERFLTTKVTFILIHIGSHVICDVLLVLYSYHVSVMHHFWDIIAYFPKF